MTSDGPARDPRDTRQQSLVVFLQVALGLVAISSLAAVLLPGRLGRQVGVATVAILIVTPVVRVSWLAVRWFLKRDLRYAFAAALLVSIVVGAELAGTF
jgi:hypothetical protein